MSCGDAPIFKINGRSHARLVAALNLAFELNKPIGYCIETSPKPRMVLFWTDRNNANMVKFPGKPSAEFIASLIEMWLNEAVYPDEPDHDGDNGRGWFMFTEGWGHIDSQGWESFLAIEPHWLMYGK